MVSLAQPLSKSYPVPMEYVGVKDKYGESGSPEELVKHFGLDSESIKKAVSKVLSRR
mgnify:CR=1 FL=1